MVKPGRNAPCPCGSGKKYKQCCLRQDRGRQQKDRLEADAAGRALTWLDEHHGEEMKDAFHDMVFGGLGDDERERLGELPEHLFGMIDINGRELVLAEGFLELDDGETRCLDLVFGPGGPLLDAVQRSYLEKLGSRPMGLYEVVESRPGQGFRLRDLVDDGEPIRWVAERAGSQGPNAAEGAVFGARLIPGSTWKLSGAVYPFPAAHVLRVLDELRFELGGKPQPALDRQVKSTVIVDAWLKFLVMPPPEIVDASTGEPMLMVNDHYRVADWDRLAAALAAEPDVEGDRQRGWIRFDDLGDDQRRSRLAINPGKGDRIEAFARTLRLAEEGKPWLEEVAGDAIRWITREIVDPASLWERRHEPRPEPQAHEPEDLPEGFHQELHEQIYRDWPDQPVPALGGRTPRQALATPEGQRRVVDLIESYERGEKEKTRAGLPAVDLGFLWQTMGLERPQRR